MKRNTSVNRMFELPTLVNKNKEQKLIALLPYWQKELVYAASIIKLYFFTTGELPQYLNNELKYHTTSNLSQRQLDSVASQALAAHQSWLGNLERIFTQLVLNSTIDGRILEDLLYINKANLWYYPITDELLVQVSKTRIIPTNTFHLARNILKHVRKSCSAPDLSTCRTMCMDGKIATLNLPKTALAADYWVRFSTLVPRDVIYAPLLATKQIRRRLAMPSAEEANFCQVVVDKPNKCGEVKVHYKIIVKTSQRPLTDNCNQEKALDWGLSTLLSTSDGELLGQGFYQKLVAYDKKLVVLTKALMKNRIKLRDSKRYLALTQDVREFVKNEVNRVFNRLLETNPNLKTIIVERLDFRGSGFSTRMRRILTNCGRKCVQTKLKSIHEDYGIKIVELNPAYTSQECNGCHFVHKTNRNNKVFHCRFCGKKEQADVGGANTIKKRFLNGQTWDTFTRRKVLAELDKQFQLCWKLSFADVVERLTMNSRKPGQELLGVVQDSSQLSLAT